LGAEVGSTKKTIGQIQDDKEKIYGYAAKWWNAVRGRKRGQKKEKKVLEVTPGERLFLTRYRAKQRKIKE